MEYKDIQAANEQLKVMPIKGKNYIMVNERIKAFRRLYPEGTIETEILDLADGVVTMKATIKNIDVILGTGHAQEKESSTYINKTSFIENCVPLDTQILTDYGWKYYHQLKEGDNVLSLNLSTNKIEYCKLLGINRYASKPLKKLKTSRFEVTCTEQHKWIVDSQYTDVGKVTTAELKPSHRIIQNIPQDVKPSEIGKKLGWLICDCEMTRTANGLPSTAYINQSKYVKEIEALFGEGRKTRKYKESWMDNYEWVVEAEEVRTILGHFGISDYRDLPLAMAKAQIEDVRGTYETMMMADGGDRGFSSTYIELIDAMQIMCARLGIATSFITKRMCQKSTKPIYTIGIKKTYKTCVSELKITDLPPKDVWCPTTENGTWFLKQGTFVTVTSNCETSAVGRALGMLGIGIDASFASYEEVANAQLNQNRAEQATQTTQRKPDTEQRKAEPKPSTEQRKQEADAYVAAEGKKITKAQLIDLGNKMAEYGIDAGYVKQKFKVENLSELTEQEYITITKNLDIIKTNSDKWRAKNAGQTA